MTATILALDASSTMIGWCLWDGGVQAYGEIHLKHVDVNHRCRLARAQVAGLLFEHPDIDAVAIESPGGRYRGGVIPQCYVSGAIRSLLAEYDIAICDVAPTAAKKALTRCGAATKRMMIEQAAPQFGYYLGNLTITLQRGTLYAMLDGTPVYGEHAADALGVARAAAALVKVVPA